MQPRTQVRQPESRSDPRWAINSDCVAAANDLGDVADLLEVVDILTRHPDREEHEEALATVIRIASETALHGREAAQRAAEATQRELAAHG